MLVFPTWTYLKIIILYFNLTPSALYGLQHGVNLRFVHFHCYLRSTYLHGVLIMFSTSLLSHQPYRLRVYCVERYIMFISQTNVARVFHS